MIWDEHAKCAIPKRCHWQWKRQIQTYDDHDNRIKATIPSAPWFEQMLQKQMGINVGTCKPAIRKPKQYIIKDFCVGADLKITEHINNVLLPVLVSLSLSLSLRFCPREFGCMLRVPDNKNSDSHVHLQTQVAELLESAAFFGACDGE